MEPRRRYLRESTGTNAPETAFTWGDLSGEVPASVGNHRDQEVQTFLPGAEPSFIADGKVGEGVRSWRAGRYKSKGGSGDGGDGSGSDRSSDESKRKRSNSTDSEEPEKHRRKKKGMTRDYLKTIPKLSLIHI